MVVADADTRVLLENGKETHSNATTSAVCAHTHMHADGCRRSSSEIMQ